jgi:transcriptional regulator with XRE-family HTH domain
LSWAGAKPGKQLAEKLEVKQNTVSRWERHGVAPDEDTLKKLADFGGVTVEWLLRGEERGAGLAEHVPEVYESRPLDLDVLALARIIAAARKFLLGRPQKLDDFQEARLLADLYCYYQTEKRLPDDQIIAAYLPLARRESNEKEG